MISRIDSIAYLTISDKGLSTVLDLGGFWVYAEGSMMWNIWKTKKKLFFYFVVLCCLWGCSGCGEALENPLPLKSHPRKLGTWRGVDIGNPKTSLTKLPK